MKPRGANDEGFSLPTGGPFYRFMLGAHLVTRPMGLLRRRIVVFVTLTWLPLLVLAVIDRKAFGGAEIPFLRDIAVNSRFLIALPVLLVGEVVLHHRVSNAVPQFVERGIVPPERVPRFEAAIASAMRLRKSITVEVLILLLTFVLIPWVWRETPGPLGTWITRADGDVPQFTAAGWWLMHFSVPVFQTLLFRMYFRLFVWARFLWQVSRMPLDLAPAHPDRAAGLGFLEQGVLGFAPILLAQSIAASGMIARRVHLLGGSVLDYRIDIAIIVVLLTIVVLLPPVLFAPTLNETRRASSLKYGQLAATCVQQFDRKWLGTSPPSEELLGAADISSVCDFTGVHDNVTGIRPVPFGLRALIGTVAVAVAPFLPLALMVLSLREIAGRLAEVLL